MRLLVCPRLLLALLMLAWAIPGAPTANAGEFPDSWFWGDKMARTRQNQLVGKAPPALQIKDWLTKSVKYEDLRGKVVLVDFWATWCGPCMRALPENNQLLKKFGDKGLAIIGIHDGTKGFQSAPGVVKNLNIEYPLGVDSGTKSASGWRVSFWPTYGVIDRSGKVRAVGLQPQHLEQVITKLLAEPVPAAEPPKPTEPKPAAPPASQPAPKVAPAPPATPIDPSWLEGQDALRQRLVELERREAPPALEVEGWRNGEALTLESLKGKVVVLNFWGTWCPHCKEAMPWLNGMAKQYKSKGLVIIGVTHNRDLESVDAVLQKYSVTYPVCTDPKNATGLAYKVNGYPDYYVIDRNGRLRIADANQSKLEDAIKALLAEKSS
jgi:thiol-disulfide isomerase/thioredoxin